MAASKFAIPGKKKYPINDKKHAANALSRVNQTGSKSEKEKVYAKVGKEFPKLAARSSVKAVRDKAKANKKVKK